MASLERFSVLWADVSVWFRLEQGLSWVVSFIRVALDPGKPSVKVRFPLGCPQAPSDCRYQTSHPGTFSP